MNLFRDILFNPDLVLERSYLPIFAFRNDFSNNLQ